MDKYFGEFINSKCEDVLNNNPQYAELHKRLAEAYDKKDIEAVYELASEMRFITESESYKLAVKDLFNILLT